MEKPKFELKDGTLIIYLAGSVSTDNATELGNEIDDIRANQSYEKLVLDLDGLNYCSSAGLRIFLKLRKAEKDLLLINVNDDIYGILEVTGFVSMLNIERKLRNISLEGAQLIGEGFYSNVYRLDRETIVKVFIKDTSIEDIRRELNLAKQAFILGVPTAISYDVVTVEGKYGTVYEMLSEGSLRDAIVAYPDKWDELLDKYAELVNIINSTDAGQLQIPSAKETYLSKLEAIKGLLSDQEYSRAKELLTNVPDSHTFVHCDCHMKNIMMSDGELMLIDMDTLSYGNRLFELSNMYSTYYLFGKINPEQNTGFFKVTEGTAERMYDDLMSRLYSDRTPEIRQENQEKIALAAYVHMTWFYTVVVTDDKRAQDMMLGFLKDQICRVDDLTLN